MVDTPPPAPAENPAVRHERTDVNFRSILRIGIIIMAIVFVINLGILWFFHGFEGHEEEVKQSQFSLAGERPKFPPEPRLEQIDRHEDITRPDVYERREDRLNSFGTTDEEGVVHIPIDLAMKLLLEKGHWRAKYLPVRKGDTAPGQRGSGLEDAGATNSGREFREGNP